MITTIDKDNALPVAPVAQQWVHTSIDTQGQTNQQVTDALDDRSKSGFEIAAVVGTVIYMKKPA